MEKICKRKEKLEFLARISISFLCSQNAVKIEGVFIGYVRETINILRLDGK